MPLSTAKAQGEAVLIQKQIPARMQKKDAMPARKVNIPNNDLRRLVVFWLPVLACALTIFYASSLPGKDVPEIFPYQSEVYHVGIYIFLAFFFARALRNTTKLNPTAALILTLAFGIFYGITDEFHQSFVPGRDVSVFDVGCDSLGTIIGILIYR